MEYNIIDMFFVNFTLWILLDEEPFAEFTQIILKLTANIICCSIRCFQNILVVFSICVTGSYILKSVYLSSK